MCVEFRDGSLSGDFSPREDQQWSRERRTATTQLAPTDTFVSIFYATRLFPNLLVTRAFFLSHLTRLASLTWNEKCKAWHSFSLTKATLVCCLFFLLSPPRTSRFRGSWISAFISNFIAILCKYPAKKDVNTLKVIVWNFQNRFLNFWTLSRFAKKYQLLEDFWRRCDLFYELSIRLQGMRFYETNVCCNYRACIEESINPVFVSLRYITKR